MALENELAELVEWTSKNESYASTRNPSGLPKTRFCLNEYSDFNEKIIEIISNQIDLDTVVYYKVINNKLKKISNKKIGNGVDVYLRDPRVLNYFEENGIFSTNLENAFARSLNISTDFMLTGFRRGRDAIGKSRHTSKSILMYKDDFKLKEYILSHIETFNQEEDLIKIKVCDL